MRAGRIFGLGALALCSGLAACASAPASPEALAANDPYEQTNRRILAFNGEMDRLFVNPTVELYLAMVPEEGRNGVHNFLGNLSKPTVLVDDLLQGELNRGRQTVERFVINTTIGLGGLFDPASRMGIPDHSEDFGQTLAVWGVKEGPYLVLPYLGPSNPRDVTGVAVDIAIDPTNFIPVKQHLWWIGTRQYFTLLDLKAQTYQTIQGIQRSSIDYYSGLRSLYRQLRENEIRNGRPASENLPDF